MRGKEHYAGLDYNPIRITPAYAGKSTLICVRQRASEDHPRVCGEKYAVNAPDGDVKGSPPRMRGKVAALVAWWKNNRDHPRVCGEKNQNLEWADSVLGSPPRMRGKACCPFSNPLSIGITPAYAGKRVACYSIIEIVQDHPRVCGEK